MRASVTSALAETEFGDALSDVIAVHASVHGEGDSREHGDPEWEEMAGGDEAGGPTGE